VFLSIIVSEDDKVPQEDGKMSSNLAKAVERFAQRHGMKTNIVRLDAERYGVSIRIPYAGEGEVVFFVRSLEEARSALGY